uniref:Uncharacterized protein n=1 Tax=Syphacia muris TaxID=451379 RepID=A0A0N5AMU7_9BILA
MHYKALLLLLLTLLTTLNVQIFAHPQIQIPGDIDFQLRRNPGYLCYGYRISDGYEIRCAGQTFKILWSAIN